MSLLLDLIYLLALLLASPWAIYSISANRGWRNVPGRFGFGIAAANQETIWLHGSSVGEVSLLRPFVARLEREHPGMPLIISSYTNTGLEAARAAYPSHRVIPFPLDFSFVVNRVLNRCRPRTIVVVESDFWPNFLAAADRRGIPTVVINGKLSEKSFRLHQRTHLIPRVLRGLSAVAVQTEEHANRFVQLGVPEKRVRVTGNMKYDLAEANLDERERLRVREQLGFSPRSVVIIGGSLHPREDLVLLESFSALKRKHEQVALMMVPRYPAQSGVVAQHVTDAGLNAVLKTSIGSGDAATPASNPVVVVDTLGELGALYAAADIAFVGGSLFYRGANKGGHNVMEPAIVGLPVLFGPHNVSFKETVARLLDADGGKLVHDAGELTLALSELVRAPERRAAMGKRAREVILQSQGATERNFTLLRPQLSGELTVAAILANQDNAASSQ